MSNQEEAGPSNEYHIPPPGKINLKKTKSERAQKVFEREARREKHRRNLISRANGYAVSPPRTTFRDESITPPRFQSTSASASKGKGKTKERIHVLDDSDEEDDIQEMGYRWMGDLGRSAKRMRVEEERMQQLEQEELMAREGDPFTSYSSASFAYSSYVETATGTTHSYSHTYSTSSTNIPARHRHGKTAQLHREKLNTSFGAVPDIGSMTDSEYAAYIRNGFDKERRAAEKAAEAKRAQDRLRQALEGEKQRLAQEKKERQRDRERQKAFRKQQRRNPPPTQGYGFGDNESDTDPDGQGWSDDDMWARDEEEEGYSDGEEVFVTTQPKTDSRALKRKRYTTRWASLNQRADKDADGDTGGDIQEIEMQYSDIPWPTYTTSLEKGDINIFLSDISRYPLAGAGGDKGGANDLRKVLRETIRIFHPDKFLGRFLARVREGDKDKVKEGVERVSRAINDLMAEQNAKGR